MKVSIIIVISIIILQFFFIFFLKNNISITYYEILAKFNLFIVLLLGLYFCFISNKENIFKKFNKKREVDPKRIKYKFISFLIGYFAIWLFSWVMVDFFNYDLYTNYYYDALFFSPVVCYLFYFWISFLDARIENPEDDYYYFTKSIIEKKFKLRDHKYFLLLYLVKIFYIPFMYGAGIVAVVSLFKLENVLSSPIGMVSYLFLLGLCFDVCIGLGGYLFSSQFFNTDTKSVEDSILGWLVCLICYPPLLIIYRFFTQQVDSFIWVDWLTADYPLYWIWAFLITLTWIFYWYSTMSFGFRFSNLSWRGLVDTGLYKYIKHPAYLSKNLYWWLHTVPFFGVVGLDVLRNFLALSFVSLIYYLRAKTEEQHLMRFEEYRAYQKMILEQGLWAKLKKIIKK